MRQRLADSRSHALRLRGVAPRSLGCPLVALFRQGRGVLSAAAARRRLQPAVRGQDARPHETGLHGSARRAAAGICPRRLDYLSHALRYLLGLLFFGNPAYSPHPRKVRRHDTESWIDFMQANLHTPLYLEQMAAAADLSVQHFRALFERQTGMAPMEYLTHLRVQRACSLLDTTPRQIADIGRAVGYEDPYYFSRISAR